MKQYFYGALFLRVNAIKRPLRRTLDIPTNFKWLILHHIHPNRTGLIYKTVIKICLTNIWIRLNAPN